MYKNCKTEQSIKRQRELEAGFLKLLSVKCYEEITVSYLCEMLDVPRKAFYRYFDSKEGILIALIDHTLDGYIAFRASQKERNAHVEINNFFLFWKTNGTLLDALIKNDLVQILVDRTIVFSMNRTVFPGRFLQRDSKDNQKHIMMFIVCGFTYLVLNWHRNDYIQDVAEISALGYRLLTEPLFSNVPSRL